MFENLVECAKTKKTSKNWIFFLATSIIWSVLLLSAIIGGIFLYDAQLDEQLSLVTMLVPPPPPPPPPPAGHPAPEVKVHQTNTTNVLPDNVAVKVDPTDIKTPTTPKKVVFADSDKTSSAGLGDGDLNGVVGGVNGGDPNGVLGSTNLNPTNNTSKNIPPPPPPPDPPVQPTLIRRSEGVIRGNSLNPVKPDYPVLARNTHISGDVQVEITINEEGNVISAHVISGHPLLQQAAVAAARQWKFNPTMLNNAAVKVQGVLTFRFTL